MHKTARSLTRGFSLKQLRFVMLKCVASSGGCRMPFDFRKLGKYRVGMLRRIADLKVKSEDSLDVAMDTMMQDRVDSYFRI